MNPAPPSAPPGYLLEYTAQKGDAFERMTLFRDGMAVYKSKRPGAPDLLLKLQFSPEETRVYTDALKASGILDVKELPKTGMTGQLVKTWTLAYALPGAGEGACSGISLQSPPLAVNKVLVLVQDITESVLKKWRGTDPFKAHPPAAGDRLETFEGHVFIVQRTVAEREQVELRGADQPLTYYVNTGELKLFFKGYADPAGKP